MARRDKERADLLNAGRAVRCSALGGDGKVHVLFQTSTGTLGFYMAPEVYSAFPLGENVTVEQYAEKGELTAAPTNFYS